MTIRSARRGAGGLWLVSILAAGLGACAGSSGRPDGGDPDAGLPMALPFELSRPDLGVPLTGAEVSEFTARITGLWRQADYFAWATETSHGMDASTGLDDYLIWWHDVDAIKLGDTVTFRNNSAYGGSHNNAVPTALVLTQAIGGYLLTGDPAMGWAVEQYAKSLTATMKGFVFDQNDPWTYLMARNIVAHNHAFELPSGKSKAVDYSDWYSTYEGWNADRLHYPNNPTWGELYVTTMRSKDDVPYLYRAAAWFPYLVALAPDERIRSAAGEALEYMRGFAADIVSSGYLIRTKDATGQAFVPDQDLASLVAYVSLFPDAECDARLATALLATGEPLDQDCGDGQGSPYDRFAGQIHYYNYAIVDHFHLAALHLALTSNQPALAERLLGGLIVRLERYRDPQSEEPGQADPSWQRDVAVLLLKAASLGMPLTSDEARQVQAFYSAAVDAYAGFPNWDLWDPSVPDGVYDFRSGFHPAHRPEAVEVEALAFLLEYCWSPFRNPAGVRFVDCDQVADPARWGQGG
jgi:hypothetical protein